MGKTALQTTSEKHLAGLVTPGAVREAFQTFCESETSTMVVEGPFQSNEGSPMVFSPGQASNNRRKLLGLGSPPGGSNRSRQVVKNRGKKIVKLARIESHSFGSDSFSTGGQRTSCTDSVRQYDSSDLCAKARGNQEPRAHGLGQSTSVMGGNKCGLPIGSPPEGITKSPSRSAKQKKSSGSRMESEPGGVRYNIGGMGTSPSGPIFKSTKCEGPGILFNSQNGSGSGDRCPGTPMELPAVLRLSPFSTNPSGPKEIQGGEHQLAPDRSFLAKKALVCNTFEPGLKTSLEITIQEGSIDTGLCVPSGSKQATSNCLVSEEDLLKSIGLSDKVVKTLLSSRKEVTRSIYLKVWKKFNSWCSSKSFEIKSTISVLEFLHEGMEKGLAASTLKTQVAALSVYLERSLSKETLISRFFRALARNRPIALKVFPCWDLSIVLQGLTGAPFEPLQSASLKNLVLKTIFLVAITSARRISELQALAIKEPFLRVLPDRVVLQTDPAFLPKVASTFHRSQEIILPTFSSVPANAGEEAFHTLDVRRCLLQFLSVTKEFRKSNALFVVFSGPRKGEKASKSTLGRWLRQAISEAYQAKGEVPPSGIAAHSTRSTAVSWAERAGATPDQICKAATWSSFSTFIRHYRLDLLSAADQAFGRKVLQAVVPP